MNIHYQKEFAEVLKNGAKKHTIRKYKIEAGTPLKHIVYPYSKKRDIVLGNVCTGSQEIEIKWTDVAVVKICEVRIDGRILTDNEIYQLAFNDGFAGGRELLEYFKTDFKGYINHWTDKRY